uniref:Phosphoserine phosphatase n=2 Tax=Hymenolepis diminuta TaxID=6216 RepID=A0A0R3SSN7_HYMDI
LTLYYISLATNFSTVRAICFDVDSTVCPEEGLDVLAEFCNKGEIVKRITSQAMDGELDVTEALDQRLKVLNLTKDLMHQFLDKNPLKLTPGIEKLSSILRKNEVDIYLVSGGIHELVDRVAKRLSIPDDHVYANKLIYNDDGLVMDFDYNQPTSRSTGKAEVVAQIKSKLAPNEGVLMVGDGATDAAASPPADAFIGFGGVVVRPAVKRTTPYYFYSFDEMLEFFKRAGLIRIL